MRTHPSSSGFAFRSLLAASALIVAPAALAAPAGTVVTILDNADRARSQTTTSYDATSTPGTPVLTAAVAPATNPEVVNPFYFTNAIDASYSYGFDASAQNSSLAGGLPVPVGTASSTRIAYSVNPDAYVFGTPTVISSGVNRDVLLPSLGFKNVDGVSSFSCYSTLAQGMGWVDLKRIETNPPETGGAALFYTSDIQGFGTYASDRTTLPGTLKLGYLIDASDYSGAGNLRWLGTRGPNVVECVKCFL